MDLDTSQIYNLRPDAHRFILGVLWLAAIGVLSLTPTDARSALLYIDSLAGSLVHLQAPSFMPAFLVVLAGVVLPYCLSEVFTPFTFLVMNLTVLVYHRYKPFDDRLDRVAASALAKDLKIDFPPPHSAWVTYVRMYAPNIAQNLVERRRELNFRAGLLLPASLLIAWLGAKVAGGTLPAPWPAILGGVLGILAFVVGAYSADKTLDQVNDSTALAVSATTRDRSALTNSKR